MHCHKEIITRIKAVNYFKRIFTKQQQKSESNFSQNFSPKRKEKLNLFELSSNWHVPLNYLYSALVFVKIFWTLLKFGANFHTFCQNDIIHDPNQSPKNHIHVKNLLRQAGKGLMTF